MKSVVFHQDAEPELDASMAYYESQRSGLGLDLQTDVARTIGRIRPANDRLDSDMTDNLTSTQRRRVMSRVRCRDTAPEIRVRQIVHRLGFRFRLHRRDLPGTPDLVFPRHKKVIFVHGCFWHQHDCPRGRRPGTNREFWDRKLDRNIERDIDNVIQLRWRGWTTLVLWECEIRRTEMLERRISEFFGTKK